MTRLPGRTSVGSTCRYDIDQNCLLGRGAFGIVYKRKIVERGNFNSRETTVAVKVTYWEQRTKSQSRVEDWLELIERWKKLLNFRPHAHLISYHKLSFNVASGGFVGFEFLMDYCDGGDLASVLSKPNCKEPSKREARKLVTELTVACYSMQIAAGLEYLHENHFIHMDLKPQNILVKRQRTGHHRLVIADLDDIIQMREAQTHSCDFPPNNVRGTLRYMSPEMLKTFANMPSLEKPGQNTDVWSLGCVMHDLIDYCYGIEERTLRKTTTEFPCDDVIMDNTTKDFQYMKLIDEGYLPVVNATIPSAFADLIGQCLVVDVKQRISAAGMKTALKGLAAKIQPNETNRPCFCGSTMANYLQLMDISENDQLRPSPLIDFGPLETLDPFASPTASAGTRACHQKTAWRVVVAAVYCCFIVDGIAGSIELIIYKYSTINVGSLVNGVLLVVAPVACVLADKFGYRLLLSIGPITASTGIAFGYFANDDILMATSAVIAGIGLGLIYSPTIIYVTAFFNGKGALAVGIVMSGSRMGGIVFSFFTGYLLEHVNRHEVLLVLSGICMLCFPICHAMTQQTLPYTEPLTSGKQSILRIYHNHALLLYTLAILSGAFAFLVPVNFLKDLPAVANSTMQLRFAVLVALMCADIIGKIVWNVCLDHTGWNPLKLHNVCIFFCGASMFMMSLCQDIWNILILTIANAFCAAPFISFATVILTKLLDVRQLPVAYGQIQLMSGIAHFVVPFLAAYINSRAAILSAGGLWMIATLIATLIFFLPRQAPLSEPVPDQEFKLSVM